MPQGASDSSPVRGSFAGWVVAASAVTIAIVGVVLIAEAVRHFIRGQYGVGSGILGTVLAAGAIAFAVSRKTPRNPRRHARAKQARKQRA